MAIYRLRFKHGKSWIQYKIAIQPQCWLAADQNKRHIIIYLDKSIKHAHFLSTYPAIIILNAPHTRIKNVAYCKIKKS
jgi:hypothetical protein